MKPNTLPVRRTPVSKGVFKRLNAVTRSRRQRVAAAATMDGEHEDNSSKISGALTIIFLIHIVAIGLIFFHQRFLDNRSSETSETPVAVTPVHVAPVVRSQENLPRLSTGEATYFAEAGDNYSRVATKFGIDEEALRELNNRVPIGPGQILKLPPRKIVAVEPPEVTAIRDNAPMTRDLGLVEAIPVDVSNAPRALLVRPTVSHEKTISTGSQKSAPVASGQTYTVQSGDTVWKIANKFKVDQNQLMRANGINDPKRLKLGMNLVIPR
jgi:LysM repeat protein